MTSVHQLHRLDKDLSNISKRWLPWDIIWSPNAPPWYPRYTHIWSSKRRNNGTDAEEGPWRRCPRQRVWTIQPLPKSCRTWNKRTQKSCKAHHGKEVHTHAPIWNYCAKLQSNIRSSTALHLDALLEEWPLKRLSREARQIFQDWLNTGGRIGSSKFRDVVPSFTDTNEVLGRWLGPSTDIGSEMYYHHILESNGKVVQRCWGSYCLKCSNTLWQGDCDVVLLMQIML